MLMERYGERLVGVLSCHDRIVITDTLTGACYAGGMTNFFTREASALGTKITP